MFESKAYGKWILAGEHSVLRGSAAIVFPIFSRTMTLTYSPSERPLAVLFEGVGDSSGLNMFWKVLDRGLETLNLKREWLKGELLLKNQIPLGSGLGASAALCVNLSRWLWHLGHLQDNEIFEFARELENTSHGESSGVDIAVSMQGCGLHFERDGETHPITLKWTPQLFLTHSGAHSKTSDCVKKVKSYIESHGPESDNKMKKSVALAERAFEENNEQRLNLLAEAIEMASSCFAEWDLLGPALEENMLWLKEHGALSAKPTGSGGGGYILSLWDTPPPEDIRDRLIPCFEGENL